jgi:hypothetical protein
MKATGGLIHPILASDFLWIFTSESSVFTAVCLRWDWQTSGLKV